MKWSILEVSKKKTIEFEEELDLTAELRQRSEEILDAKPVKVQGQVSYDTGIYYLDYTLKVELIIPSSRSLKPVDYLMELSVSEAFTTEAFLKENKDLLDDDMIFTLDEDWISLSESVADNILLEIPLQVLAEDERDNANLPSGKNWTVLSEADYRKQKEEETDKEKKSPFADLAGLFTEEKN
ncbi:YceD family protein [Lactococcus ileimucosae]|uniref:YceD family protein n=1 Tax=Lactococcus ileimucosae TaxID=2941329 RepID=A0ABV4CZX8_9LACT